MPTLYAQRSDGSLATYSGMDELTVTSLLTAMGLTGIFLTAAEYETAVAALPVIKKPDFTPLMTALNTTPSTDAKLTALIALLQAKGVL